MLFATRNPSKSETLALQLLLSTYCDGTGTEIKSDLSTRPNWQQIERSVADLLGTRVWGGKFIFDVVAADDDDQTVHYGLSIKSKKRGQLQDLFQDLDSRMYIEVSNSLSSFWKKLRDYGLSEDDFRNGRNPNLFGEVIIQTISEMHHKGKVEFEELRPGNVLDLDNSVYLCFSYCETEAGEDCYVLHCFPLKFPDGIVWKFSSKNCIRGYDPDRPDQKLIEWYGLSGGQMKYYPRSAKAITKTELFSLITPNTKKTSVSRALDYYPKEFSMLDSSTLRRFNTIPEVGNSKKSDMWNKFLRFFGLDLAQALVGRKYYFPGTRLPPRRLL